MSTWDASSLPVMPRVHRISAAASSAVLFARVGVPAMSAYSPNMLLKASVQTAVPFMSRMSFCSAKSFASGE